VIFDTDASITGVSIQSSSGHEKDLFISSVPKGRTLYLFVTPAGEYCLHKLHIGNDLFANGAPDQCFEVIAGRISYGGDFIPSVSAQGSRGSAGGTRTLAVNHSENPQGFLALLKSTYPKILADIEAAPDH